MKTLGEIIEAVKDGDKPDYDDLLYGLLAMSHLHSFMSQDILKVYQKTNDDKPFGAKFIAKENFNRSKYVMGIPPKDYIGDEWNPSNPEYQKQRAMMKKLADKIVGE